MAEDPGLVDLIKNRPATLIPELEKAATRLAKEENAIQLQNMGQSSITGLQEERTETSTIPVIQVASLSLFLSLSLSVLCRVYFLSLSSNSILLCFFFGYSSFPVGFTFFLFLFEKTLATFN